MVYTALGTKPSPKTWNSAISQLAMGSTGRKAIHCSGRLGKRMSTTTSKFSSSRRMRVSCGSGCGFDQAMRRNQGRVLLRQKQLPAKPAERGATETSYQGRVLREKSCSPRSSGLRRGAPMPSRISSSLGFSRPSRGKKRTRLMGKSAPRLTIVFCT